MLTIEKVVELLKNLRTQTEKGEIIWTPFAKKNNTAGLTAVGFSTTTKNGTVFKIKYFEGDIKRPGDLASLTLKAKVIKDPEDRLESYMIKVASITSTPSLKDDIFDLYTAVILANRKIPDWAESSLLGE